MSRIKFPYSSWKPLDIRNRNRFCRFCCYCFWFSDLRWGVKAFWLSLMNGEQKIKTRQYRALHKEELQRIRDCQRHAAPWDNSPAKMHLFVWYRDIYWCNILIAAKELADGKFIHHILCDQLQDTCSKKF